MFIKKNAAPFFFAVLGTLGFFLRKSELDTAFEPTSGLFEPWHIMSFIMLALAVGAVVLAAYFAFSVGHQAEKSKEPVKISWTLGHFTIGLIAAVLLGIGSYSFYSGLWYSTFELPWLEKLFVFLAAVCAICIAFMCCVLNRTEHGSVSKAAACMTPVFFCIWLLYFYRLNAVDPAIQIFVWQCFSLALAALGTFYYAGFLYGTASASKTVWCLLMGEFTGIVAIADQTSFDGVLLTSAAALWITALASSAINSFSKD